MAYRLTRLAEDHLIECYLYGYRNFGEPQAERYQNDIRHCFEILSANPKLARVRKEYRLPVRVHHHNRHFVAYIMDGESGDITILAVLHDTMDLARHLQDERSAPE